VFKTLTGTPDLQANIADLFKHFVSYYMFDHVAIESEAGLNMETIHVLSKSKQFEHIPPEVIGSVVNNAGLLHINSTEMVDDTSHGEIIERLKAQNVSAALYCEIAAYGKLYGYLRVDMADKSRIWQAGEMDILVIAANAIGLILHYENKALTEFEVREPIIIGESN
jgi:transcriptional regulator with GAF, ATPase, and Fis domain